MVHKWIQQKDEEETLVGAFIGDQKTHLELQSTTIQISILPRTRPHFITTLETFFFYFLCNHSPLQIKTNKRTKPKIKIKIMFLPQKLKFVLKLIEAE